jgi:hypothetical protein
VALELLNRNEYNNNNNNNNIYDVLYCGEYSGDGIYPLWCIRVQVPTAGAGVGVWESDWRGEETGKKIIIT